MQSGKLKRAEEKLNALAVVVLVAKVIATVEK